MANCGSCGARLHMANRHSEEQCQTCFEEGRPLSDQGSSDQVARSEEIARILVTTEMQPSIDISERLGVITAECAFGMNVFKDIFAGIRNIVGGRSKAIQDTMRSARETALYELKVEADMLGADAVVAVDIDYFRS